MRSFTQNQAFLQRPARNPLPRALVMGKPGPYFMGRMPQEPNRLGPAGLFALVVLLGFLAVAIWYAIHVWSAMAGVPMSPLGWLFLGMGAFFTILVGGGLMALVFYSSRHNMDR
jgi:hypothetical protein